MSGGARNWPTGRILWIELVHRYTEGARLK